MSNNNNNNNNVKEKSEAKNWVSLFLYILLGLAIGYALAKGFIYLKNRASSDNKVKVVNETKNNSTSTVEYNGTTKDNTTVGSEQDHAAGINFRNNSDLKVTQGSGNKDNYYYVADKNGNNLATIYLSNQSGRKTTATDYINNVIRKAVPTASAPAIVTYGDSSWMYTASANSEWHVAPAVEGMWLIVIENKKANHDQLTSIYETLNIK